MNKIYIKNILIILLCLLLKNVFAEINQHKINSLQDKILNSNNKLTSVEQSIKNIDQQISQKILLLEEINADLKKIENEKKQLSQQKLQNIENLNKQKQSLIKQLETAYVINRNSNIQKISNINNLQQLNRFLTYLDSYNQFNHHNINEIKNFIKNIEELDISLTSLNIQQQKNKQTVTTSYEELKTLKANNIELKNKLQAGLNTELARLDYYQKQYNKLTDTLNQEDLETSQEYEDINQNLSKIHGLFKNAKGRLPLPVSGIIDVNFQNNIKSNNAIFIKTPEGKKVKAIFNGKVVFSNWLRGFGFLTIIDHGYGYMSLYGNNQTLLKSTGSKVTAGEYIAITGSSGGIATPGLYFEIRYNGNPINTVAWLKSDQDRKRREIG
jgi:septal ring factor EnvC (AmiA/AmiB activator)